MAVGDVYEVVPTFTSGLATGMVENVLHYVVASESAGASPLKIAEGIGVYMTSTWFNRVKGTLSNKLSLSNVAVIGVTDPTFRHDTPFTGVGSSTSPLMSVRSAVVVKKITGQRGRTKNGRFFLYPPTEDECHDGALNQTALGVRQAIADALLDVEISAVANLGMVVYSRKESRAQGRPIVTPVSGATVRSVLGSIRGRRRVS